MTKALVLASGGLDSTVLLSKVVKEYGCENVTALNIFYGQKHKKEAEFAKYQAEKYGVNYITADLSSVFKFSKDCPLLEGSDNEIPEKSYAEQLKDMGGQGTVSTYVPFRNGLFLSYAAAIAIQFGASKIFYGAHSDDAAGSAYPDCSGSFIENMARAIYEGTGGEVSLEAPFWNLTKKDIVKIGLDLGVDFAHTWSCYKGKEEPCRRCATCIDRERAFELNGIEDPLIRR
ncbi:7-cyano-7-deazaguanine synthase QueC [Caloramator australicus]|uniref:7-cyano-7-deazaguanine synthase n=1 Tax=Caloramator australicus RC3 TaxID=857293 RepID=I7LHK9_9CLOT|nr:7-cyano-7-deazaguanine synthase QueC [Caloramator australicus]CCJ34111.1 Queuosine Biosynthesis QueC ATPase [Caloramator australicus RC3]